MVAHADHLGGGHDVEPLRRAVLRLQHGADARLVAEEHDPAVGTDPIERQHGAFDGRLGSEIASHSI